MDLQSAFSARRGGMGPPSAADRLQRLGRYWRTIRGERVMPARTDFDPVDVPDLLPLICLIDVGRGRAAEPSYNVRLAGTALCNAIGGNAAGKAISPENAGGVFSADALAYLRWACQTCAETRTPVAARALIRTENKDQVSCNMLLLPMGVSDETVDTILMIGDISSYSPIRHGAITHCEFDWQA